mmetsp:Transcript_19645/g.36206  ORF Transcript_19645/g.36206 Transcript_19645/m.36206 type:complete len:614 (-) Transcript_19645:3732-5573(-)
MRRGLHEERKGSMPVVETTFMSQHGQGAPSHCDDYIIGESLEAPPSSESPIRIQNPSNLKNSSNKTTPTHSPRSRSRIDMQHEGQSFNSDFSSMEDIRILQSELRRMKLALDKARRRSIITEVELQTERLKSCKLEEEFNTCRRTIASREHGDAGLKFEAEQLRSSLDHKNREITMLSKETSNLSMEKAKLKEHINSIWNEYQAYKDNADSLIKELEIKLTEQRPTETPERITVDNSENAELRQESERLRKQLSQSRSDLEAVRTTLHKKEVEHSHLAERTKELEGVKLALKEQVLGKDKQITQLNAQLEKAQDEAAKLKEASKANLSAKDQASNLQKTIDKQHSQIKDLEKELAAAHSKVSELQYSKPKVLKIDACVECEVIEAPKDYIRDPSPQRSQISQVAHTNPFAEQPTKSNPHETFPAKASLPEQTLKAKPQENLPKVKSPEPLPSMKSAATVPKSIFSDQEPIRKSPEPIPVKTYHQDPSQSLFPQTVQTKPYYPEPKQQSPEPTSFTSPTSSSLQNPEVPEQPEEMMDFSSDANPFDFFEKASRSPNPPPQSSRVPSSLPKKSGLKPASNLFAQPKAEEPDDFFELMAQEPAKRKYGNVPKSLFD